MPDPKLTRNRDFVERLFRGNPRTNDKRKACVRCHKFIFLTQEEWLERHSRKGTYHPVNTLTEEEKAIGRFCFHPACAREALDEAKEKSL